MKKLLSYLGRFRYFALLVFMLGDFLVFYNHLLFKELLPLIRYQILGLFGNSLLWGF
ncbi:hypothetical protein [Streptococcus equi]|uniref:hypothetical protein n=1 Tax=Streptococcus equi TaxID=1336 RepID=UPI001E5350AB|nr:hypothetical protein [Streptococcus equi]